MMANCDSEATELSEEQQLKEQLEKICLDYQQLIKNSNNMAPKDTNTKKIDPNAENDIDDDDLEGKLSSNTLLNNSELKKKINSYFHG